MFNLSKKQWNLLWVATITILLLAGGTRWPALFQTPDQRADYYRERWAAETVAQGEQPGAVELLLAASDHITRADRDVRYIRFVAVVAVVITATLAFFQTRARRLNT